MTRSTLTDSDSPPSNHLRAAGSDRSPTGPSRPSLACHSTERIRRPWDAEELLAAVGLTEHANVQLGMDSPPGTRAGLTNPPGHNRGFTQRLTPPVSSSRRPQEPQDPGVGRRSLGRPPRLSAAPLTVRLSGLILMPMSERCWWGRAHSSASAVRGPRLA